MKQKTPIQALALSFVKGIGTKMYKQLIDTFGSAQQIFSTSPNILIKKGKISPIIAEKIQDQQKLLCTAKSMYEKNTKLGIQIIPYESSAYPERLRHLADPPKVLYTTNNAALNSKRIVSIVGTRNASPYGIRWVKKFIQELKPYEPTIVSGLAHGIDFYAHQEALKESLPTVGVMAGALDVIYPSDHTDLAHKIAQSAGLVSELSMGLRTERYNFPVRNRIIVGMSDAVIVVEAAPKSGALITATYANDLERDVFALPGSVDNHYSAGCNELIRSHKAHLITSADEFAYLMNWDIVRKKSIRKTLNFNTLPNQQKKIASAMHSYNTYMGLEEIKAKVKKVHFNVTKTIFELQKQNLVESIPGNKYRLCA